MSKYAGIIYAAGAYTLWGLLVVFWKALGQVPASEILAHRMVWTLVAASSVLVALRRFSLLPAFWHSRRTCAIVLSSSLLLGGNWFVYVWAVNAGFVLECSLGYFINPLFNVLLGMLFLRERLRRAQVISVALAAAGVIYLTLDYGRLPWIALILAGTFGFYGLLRKIGKLGSLEGLFLETSLLFLPAIAFLFQLEASGSGSFVEGPFSQQLLLMISGPFTALPLILFASAAKRVSMATLGLMQYIAPTLQFILAVFVYQEDFTQPHLIAFAAIWTALVIYSTDSWNDQRQNARLAATA